MTIAHQEPRVLLVEDDDTVRRLSTRILTGAGFQVTAVESGCAALAYIAQASQVTLIVVDLRLGDVPGTEVARLARRAHPEVSVLYTTGYVDDLFEGRHCLGEGEAFLEKPYSGQGLVEAVNLLFYGRLAASSGTLTVN